eukprot:410267-Rhodomonas_salina.1
MPSWRIRRRFPWRDRPCMGYMSLCWKPFIWALPDDGCGHAGCATDMRLINHPSRHRSRCTRSRNEFAHSSLHPSQMGLSPNGQKLP